MSSNEEISIRNLIKHKDKSDFIIDKIKRISINLDLSNVQGIIGPAHVKMDLSDFKTRLTSLQGILHQLQSFKEDAGLIFYYDPDTKSIEKKTIVLNE